MANTPINTDRLSDLMRGRVLKLEPREVLVANLKGTSQEQDLTEPINCNGFGRIRHFRRETSPGWPANPLPLDPAANKLGIPVQQVTRAQVFQNAACNWRCWYCYVPFSLLSGSPEHAGWMTAGRLVELYQSLENRPLIIDLSGGQPDLTPEWVPWMMKALEDQGLAGSTYLWSDDNLSNDFLWRHLSSADRARIVGYQNYGKVGCFKGFDAESFAFNTGASPSLFDRQFELMNKQVRMGIDIYGYATFTAGSEGDSAHLMGQFVDRLQRIAEQFPLRVIPLEVRLFRPSQDEGRIKERHQNSFEIQRRVIACWNAEIERRFTREQRSKPIYEVEI